MAAVSLVRKFPDGDQITVQVQVDPSFPDALDEARTQAMKAFREACDIALPAVEPDEQP